MHNNSTTKNTTIASLFNKSHSLLDNYFPRDNDCYSIQGQNSNLLTLMTKHFNVLNYMLNLPKNIHQMNKIMTCKVI